ncbi:MAG: argininosuccinate synthase [Candidatus Tectomicrobia bacterium]|uniref:Argininosuccinate synthase n=1 Tax=Tectimicrobiota bacterium TaxID=2528274 RepID=A0A932GQ67_UNCTE|nr:argininosuccinate synthase [Candidatus Tectomicrobia bacterium]
MKQGIDKIVLAYSGGLDTSVILSWLKETYRCPVIAFFADLGQEDDPRQVEEKALKTGASQVVIEDLRDEFVRDYVFPILRAAAVYEGSYLLGTSIARPLIARKQIEIAHRLGARAVAHGATGKGNDQVRFEVTYLALDPHISIVAPWREWNLGSRQALVNYAREHGIPIPVTPERPYSCDRNLLHISYEGGILEDPWLEPSEDMYIMTTTPEKAPDEPEYVEIDFLGGNPVAVNGLKLHPTSLLALLNEKAGRHGIGRVDMVENRFVGMKSRGVYETPGGTLLHIAHRAIESLTLDREVMHLRDSLIPRYSELVYYGFWFSPEREMLQAAIDETQKPVEGTVRLKLYRGSCRVVGRKSPRSLYRHDLATFEEAIGYNPSDASGFIRLNALRLQVRALLQKETVQGKPE